MTGNLKQSLLITMLALATVAPALEPREVEVDESVELEAYAAIDRAVNFLINQQSDNGSWSNDSAVTALVIAALVQCTEEPPEKALRHGAGFIAGQARDNGSIAGAGRSSNAAALSTVASTIALMVVDAEAHGAVIESALQTVSAPDYAGNMQVLFWLTEAAQVTKMLDLKKRLVIPDYVGKLIKRCQHHDPASDLHGRIFCESTDGDDPDGLSGTRTAYGIACLFRAGGDRRDPEVAAAVASLNRSFFTLAEYPDARSKALYTFYHAYANAHSLLDDQYRKLTERPPKWRKELIEVLMAQQLGDGQWQHRNSADENDPNWATAHVLLTLRLSLD
ncbi:MAG: hypothetical protein ACKJSG_15415 [Lentisphaeria bacterium]